MVDDGVYPVTTQHTGPNHSGISYVLFPVGAKQNISGLRCTMMSAFCIDRSFSDTDTKSELNDE